MTLPEVRLWKVLLWKVPRGSKLNDTRIRRQHPVGPYVLDFYVPAAKLGIEVDGAAHDIPTMARRDVERDRWLEEQGIRILRFNASDVLDAERRENIIETIVATLVRTI